MFYHIRKNGQLKVAYQNLVLAPDQSVPVLINLLEYEELNVVKADCNGVTETVVITKYIGVVHTERDQCH